MVNIINKFLSATLQSTQFYAATIHQFEMNSVPSVHTANGIVTTFVLIYDSLSVQALITKVL